MGQDGIGRWRRESQPLMLILLKNFQTQSFLPPNLPLNDPLRRADFLYFLLVRACSGFFLCTPIDKQRYITIHEKTNTEPDLSCNCRIFFVCH